MEDHTTQGASKKKIKVRKSRSPPNSSISNINYDEDYYIPIATNDSLWNGIKFTVPKDENIEHSNCLPDQENEIKVIELDNEESLPLLLLFPELKNEELNFQNIFDQQVSTTEVTKMLVGKKPNLALLKPCKKLNNRTGGLSIVEELSESDDSIEYTDIAKSRLLENVERYRRKESRDADASSSG